LPWQRRLLPEKLGYRTIFEFAIPENPIVHEISDSIIEFADSLDPTINPKNYSVFYTELKFVQFWLIFAPFAP